ncbi:MAG TPA: protein kinase [Thermoanaerobaculia bacterium]|nr:protein kinase [Thermoanaerobaculia bacterium]
MIADMISHYEVLEVLERGDAGAGLVYRAVDRRTGVAVALAVVPAPRDAAALRRFRHDAEITSALAHPHISPVLDLGEIPEGGLFLIQPLDGESLRSRLERGPLPPEQAVGLASQIAAALGRAHQAGVIHSDLRPARIVLTADGHVRVAGFGLCWLSANGSPPAQAAYRSPEQLRGAAPDARTDVWALGVLLYEMITGRLPFRGSADDEAFEPISAVNPGVPAELDEIVARALAREPAGRPARMDDLLVILRGLLAGGDLAHVEDTLVQVPGTQSGSRASELSALPPAEPAPPSLDLSGTHVAQYHILVSLGGGAMGTVYMAVDTRLHRTVALKFLPDELTRDPVANARFLQEARAASALDHLNICTVHEIGETAEGQLFLAMAAYDGETVKERIGSGPLPIREAVEIARQAAQGLAKAHREGIVHRDVKPANLMVTREGIVKVLDFGVAKLRGAAGANPAGAFLGTPAYMSPEQARGEEVDARADVFSLGVVLYEMVAGRRPFRSGEGVTSALRSVLEDSPEPLRRLRPEVPAELERIVERMLAKAPAGRYPTAAALVSDLTALETMLDPSTAAVEGMGRRKRVAVVAGVTGVAILTAAALAVGSYLALRARTAQVQPAFTRLTDFEGREGYPALAPDGGSFVYARSVAGQMDVFLQRIGGGAAVNLTAGSTFEDNQPAISPDGLWIAFRSERDGGGIYLMPRGGGPSRRLSSLGYNPAWSPDSRELAVATEGIVHPAHRRMESQIWAIEVATGRRRLVVEDDGVQPSWSPRGSRIAYWGVPAGGARRILWTIPAAGGAPGKVLDDGYLNWNPVWSPDGKSLYFGSDRSGSLNLWRLPIDERTGAVLGEPEPVTTPSTASGFWSFSRGGDKMIYAADEGKSNLERLPFDTQLTQVTGPAVAVTRGSHAVRSGNVSPDGRWVAFHAALPWEDLFVVRANGSGLKQLTRDRHKDRNPVWSPDGRRLLFYSNRGGLYEAWMLGMAGGGLERVVPSGEKPLTFPVWAPDGRRVACAYGDRAAVIDLAEPLASRQPRPLPPASAVGESFYPTSWSPDGERLAGNIARLDDSLLDGIGVYSFGSRTYERWTSRGALPIWLRDGRRLLYIEAGKILAFDTRTYETREVLAPPSSSTYALLSTSPDEHNLFVVRTIDEGDIWLLTLSGEKKAN